jgi:tungstate transport system substrate-binding protein
MNSSTRNLLLLALVGAGGCSAESDHAPASSQQTVRCAVIGGIVETGLWSELSKRYQEATGVAVEVVASGPKHEIAQAIPNGQADLVTMHACDTIINLVADGHASDPQPWMKNDFLIVGPASDPAGIHGETSAVTAIRKIVESRSKLLIHASLGVQEVLEGLLAEAHVELDAESTLMSPVDKHRQMVLRAGKEGAYTLVGRIPFLNGKIPNRDLEIMVQGDPRLRRPYVVVVANPQGQARGEAAGRFARFLRAPETQAWIANFGRGQFDDQPLFFPIDPRNHQSLE